MTERIETCECGGPLIVREWVAGDGHKHRFTCCDTEGMITTIDCDLAMKLMPPEPEGAEA